jgi:hypothetical protein
MKGPMLKVTGLWAKSSVKGGQYLTGRLGAVKVLVMENRDRKSDDDPSHHLFFVEAPDRRHGAQECGGGQRAPAEPRTNPRPSQPQQSGSQTHAIAEDDDVPSWER